MMETKLQQPLATAGTRSPVSDDSLKDIGTNHLESTTAPAKAPAKANQAVETQGLREKRQKSTADLASKFSESSLIPPLLPANPVSSTGPPPPPVSSRPSWKSVVGETVYFAGGLISHPFESTKHFTILRHSSAVVYYRGPSTNVAISVFADAALPLDRSFWIQRKGFSGNMGMAASALMRTTSNWIEVTPPTETSASNVPEMDERAWQRDIKRFLNRAATDKRLSKHVLLETCVLRIPAEVGDGYMRIVMCTGQNSKKTLCPSPTFRLASTSSDASVLRGSSLKTLPLEVGLKVASLMGSNYATGASGSAQGIVENMQPAFLQENMGSVAFVKENFVDPHEPFDAERDVTYDPLHEHSAGPSHGCSVIIGSDSGPEKPFPIKFDGRAVAGTGQGLFPTANLSNVLEEILLRLSGIYVGWAAIEPTGATSGALPLKWYEALISIGPSPYATTRVVAQNKASVHIIHDFGESSFLNAKLKVIIMAFLRSTPKPDSSSLQVVALLNQDKEVALASLDRKGWRYEAALQIISDEKAQKSLSDRYVALRSQVQRRVDSIPLHLAGVRTERAGLKDRAYGRGGFYIRR
ncbi:hypothetical protein F5Y17DRAFT_190388 [Xylariaceae sp. FL0594]|nr:hypothetical protein F5Y17DRAFT_190388 [Xylariaceae sp. FL0594]